MRACAGLKGVPFLPRPKMSTQKKKKKKKNQEKKQGICAGLNKPLTLVMTDVEGSTELWEWDRVVMMEAITLHDRIMRANLAK